jgi:hypothetical protein
MLNLLALAAGACLAISGAPALAQVTYTGSGSVGSTGTYNLSVTTDGALGSLSDSDITDFTIMITDSHGSLTLTPLNAGVEIGGGLSATSTDLLFDFSSSGYALFQNPAPGSSENFLCFAGQICGSSSGAINLLVGNDFPGGVSTTAMSGNVVIASVAGAVPEPATWALMLVGFGGIAFALRRRKAVSAVPQLT